MAGPVLNCIIGGEFGNDTKVLLSSDITKRNIKRVGNTFELDRMVFQIWLWDSVLVKGDIIMKKTLNT